VPEDFHKERIENLFSAVHKGFLGLCGEAANCMAFCVLSSIARDTVALLFTAKWLSTRPVSMVFVTMEDFDADIGKWLSSDFYVRRFRRRFFEILVQVYLEKLVSAFRVLNSTSFEPPMLQKFGRFTEETFNKKELSQVLSGTFRETVYRDKAEFMEYANKFEIGFNCDTFFSGLIRIREGGEIDGLITAVQGFVPNGKELIQAVASVLTGKKYH